MLIFLNKSRHCAGKSEGKTLEIVWFFCMTVQACKGHNKFIVSGDGVEGVRDGVARLYTL